MIFRFWIFHYENTLRAGQGCVLPMGLEDTFIMDDVIMNFLAKKERINKGRREILGVQHRLISNRHFPCLQNVRMRCPLSLPSLHAYPHEKGTL